MAFKTIWAEPQEYLALMWHHGKSEDPNFYHDYKSEEPEDNTEMLVDKAVKREKTSSLQLWFCSQVELC